MRLRSALLATTVLATALAASARADPPITGLYGAAGGGYGLLQDERLHPGPVSDAEDGTAGHHHRSDDGYDGVASLGYGLGNGFRIEAEGQLARARSPQ